MNTDNNYGEVIAKIEKKITEEIDYEDGIFETLAEEVFEQINSDDYAFSHKGYDLWNAYKENPEVTDGVLMALCGWSMKSLLIFAGLIEDDEGLIT